MKKIKYISIAFVFLIGFSTQAQQTQTKKWTLEECVKYALENNISIKQTALDTRLANINKKDAIGNFIPSLNTSASHSWNVGLNTDPTTNIKSNQTTQYTSFGANVGFDIYKGLQNQNTLRRSKLAIVAAQYQLTKMQEDVALNVANAFLQVLFNKGYLQVQKDQMIINEKQLNRSQELVNAGTIPRGDLLDIKATMASDNQKVITAENELLISKLSLAQLLQLEDFYSFDVVDDTTVKDENNILEQTPIAIYDKAKSERTELKIAKTNLEIAMKDLAIAKGGYQPTLQGFYNFNSTISYADNFTVVNGVLTPQPALPFGQQFKDNKGQTFGAQLNIPIFNGFSVRNNVDRSKVDVDRKKIALEQEQLSLQRNVYTAYTDAKGALNAHESALVALEARKGSYNYAKEKFDVGLMNSFDFFQSQTLQSNAEAEVIRTKYDYIFKIKILEFYFGIPIIQIMQK